MDLLQAIDFAVAEFHTHIGDSEAIPEHRRCADNPRHRRLHAYSIIPQSLSNPKVSRLPPGLISSLRLFLAVRGTVGEPERIQMSLPRSEERRGGTEEKTW